MPIAALKRSQAKPWGDQDKIHDYKEKGRQESLPSGLCHRVWWSWGDLNPRPQAFFVQFYMCSRLI